MFKSIITGMIAAGLVLAPVAEAVAAKKDKKSLVKKQAKKSKKVSAKRHR